MRTESDSCGIELRRLSFKRLILVALAAAAASGLRTESLCRGLCGVELRTLPAIRTLPFGNTRRFTLTNWSESAPSMPTSSSY
eukprot:3101074-Prymnesium_polylepis.1